MIPFAVASLRPFEFGKFGELGSAYPAIVIVNNRSSNGDRQRQTAFSKTVVFDTRYPD
jgi:hypothetical protein